MTNKNMIKYVKRWKALESRRDDIDFEFSKLARDMRSEFPSGQAGDRQFIGWCQVELGATHKRSSDLLSRSASVMIVADSSKWKRLGGHASIRHLVGIPKTDRNPVIMQAIGSGGDIKAVMRSRGLLAPSKNKNYRADAERLAEYVSSLINAPRYVRDIASKYVKQPDRHLRAA